MTHTISEADITVTQVRFGSRHGRTTRYVLTAPVPGLGRPDLPVTIGRADNYAEAIQARADIIDARAGDIRVGDTVRIGRGKVTYEVRSILPWGELGLRSEGAETTSVRYVKPERLHVVRAER